MTGIGLVVRPGGTTGVALLSRSSDLTWQANKADSTTPIAEALGVPP